jgi:Icc protein
MTATIRILQISDLHLRADPKGHLRGAVTLDTLRACLLGAMPSGPYDAILVTGDLVQDEPAGYAHLQHLLGTSTAPVICLPGNHDDSSALGAAFRETPFQTLGRRQLGEWLIVALDSTVPGQDGGRLGEAELSRLDDSLCEHSGRPAIVALHHPPVKLGSQWLDALGLAEADQFWAVIDRHPGVRAVLFGHAHQVHASQRGHLHVLGAPATSAQFLPFSDDFAIDDRPPGWRVLTLYPDGHFTTEVGWLSEI